MKTTMTLAQNLSISPFEIFNQECDEVIMLINFYIELGNDQATETKVKQPHKNDGFWDM